MRLRVFIIEPSEPIRRLIAEHVTALGHEAVLALSADKCPLGRAETACCFRGQACGDAIILGQDVPVADGLAFIKSRLQGGCRGAAVNNAVIFRPLSPKVKSLAEEVDCRYLEAHALFDNIADWLKEFTERVPAERLLVPLAGAE